MVWRGDSFKPSTVEGKTEGHPILGMARAHAANTGTVWRLLDQGDSCLSGRHEQAVGKVLERGVRTRLNWTKVLRGLTTSTANVSWDHSEQMEPQLTGCKAAEESEDNNSLRNVHRWDSPRMKYVGKQLQNLIYRWVDDHSQVQTEILDSLGGQSCMSEELQGGLQQLRLLVRDLLVRNKHSEMSDTCSVDKLDNENYKTDLRGELLQYWASCVDDPGKLVADWILNRAPAGLSCGTEELDGAFSRVSNTREGDYHDLVTEYATFTNYAGVEDNEEATKAIESYAEKGYLKRFDKLQDLEVFLGARPILSKIGCIVKQKKNHVTGVVSTRTRIILDCKASAVSRSADRAHKSVLPRASNATQTTLMMQADLKADEIIVFLVADIVDAFWLVPLRLEERRFFRAKLKGSYYCFLRTAQGSRAAPLTFAAVIAMVVQSIMTTLLHRAMKTEEARVQTYVDDPLFSIRGSPERAFLEHHGFSLSIPQSHTETQTDLDRSRAGNQFKRD